MSIVSPVPTLSRQHQAPRLQHPIVRASFQTCAVRSDPWHLQRQGFPNSLPPSPRHSVVINATHPLDKSHNTHRHSPFDVRTPSRRERQHLARKRRRTSRRTSSLHLPRRPLRQTHRRQSLYWVQTVHDYFPRCEYRSQSSSHQIHPKRITSLPRRRHTLPYNVHHLDSGSDGSQVRFGDSIIMRFSFGERCGSFLA